MKAKDAIEWLEAMALRSNLHLTVSEKQDILRIGRMLRPVIKAMKLLEDAKVEFQTLHERKPNKDYARFCVEIDKVQRDWKKAKRDIE